MSIRPAVLAGCAMVFCTLTTGVAEARAHDQGAPHHRAARSLLRAQGITVFSSGHCADRRNPHCTSFKGLRRSTLRGVIRLRRKSGCRIVISGGTEVGHARMRFSHGHGYKLDILANRCLNRFIRRHFKRARTRGDGALQYRSPHRAALEHHVPGHRAVERRALTHRAVERRAPKRGAPEHGAPDRHARERRALGHGVLRHGVLKHGTRGRQALRHAMFAREPSHWDITFGCRCFA